jgi:glycosyltransferase 2 family protein
MSLSEKSKSALSFLLRIGLSSVLLIFIFSKIDTERTWEVLKTADLRFIYYAGLIFFVINLILLWRWFIFIRALDLSVSVWNVVRFFFIGLFGNLFMPTAIGGDFIKIIGLCKNSHQKPRVIASVLLDRLSGFAGLVLVAVCAYLFGYRFIEDKTLLIPIILMAAVSSSVVAVLFNERIYAFGCRIFDKLPQIKKNLMHVHYDIALLKQKHKPFEGIKGVLISCLSQAIFAFMFYLTAKALHHDISMIYFLVFVPIMCVAAAFPSIGGLGFREGAAAVLFSTVGVDKGIAVSLSLISFLFMVMVGLLGGVIYVFTVSSRRVQYNQSNVDVRPKEA